MTGDFIRVTFPSRRAKSEEPPTSGEAGVKKEEKKAPAEGAVQLELAQAYVPFQKYQKLYSPEEALRHGTLFKELYRPYPR